MKSKHILLVCSFAAAVALSTACQTTSDNKAANANAIVTNSNTTSSANVSQPAATKTEPGAANVVADLTTPTGTYKAGYAARQQKDIATLKRVFSKDAIEFLTEIGTDEKKTLDDQLKELADKPQAATAETRNEKITGNRASLEYLDEKGKWSSMEFAKEGNEWKIDLPKAP